MKNIKVGKATKTKKATYLIASIILGFLFSVIFHSVIEIIFINFALKNDQSIFFYGSCSLHPIFQVLIIISGIMAGYLFGQYWWRKIYLDRILDKKKNKYEKK